MVRGVISLVAQSTHAQLINLLCLFHGIWLAQRQAPFQPHISAMSRAIVAATEHSAPFLTRLKRDLHNRARRLQVLTCKLC